MTAVWYFLQNLLVKTFFGPWFVLQPYVDKLSELLDEHSFLREVGGVILGIVSIFILKWSLRQKNYFRCLARSKFLKISSSIAIGASEVVLLGGTLNMAAMLANHFKMPVFVYNHSDRLYYTANIGYGHCLNSDKTKLFWLCDHQYPDSRVVQFLYGDSYVSVGDLATTAVILIYWIMLALVFYAVASGCYKIYRLILKKFS